MGWLTIKWHEPLQYCAFCGKKMSFDNNDDRPEMEPEGELRGHVDPGQVCHGCSVTICKLIHTPYSVYDLGMIQNTSMLAHKQKAVLKAKQCLPNMSDTTFKQKVTQWVADAEEILHQRDEIRSIFTEVADRCAALFKEIMGMDSASDFSGGSTKLISNTPTLKDSILSYSKYSIDDILRYPTTETNKAIRFFASDGRYDIQAVRNEAATFESLFKKSVFRIPVQDILYFQERGSLQYTTSISGGNAHGGGVNIEGALRGGLLFGAAGAIVGSRLGTDIHVDPITTETNTHDNRYIAILCRSNKTNDVEEYQIPFEHWDTLMNLIPSKEYGVVQTNANQQQNPPTTALSTDTIEQLKQLKELLDQGILTQEEFDTKKKQMLGL